MRTLLKYLIYFFLLLWLIVSYNGQFAQTTAPFVGVGINVVLEAVLFILMLPAVLSTHINTYQKWVLIILIYWGATALWSVESDAFHFFYTISISYLFCLFLSANISTKKSVEIVLKLELIAIFLCAIYVLLFVNTGSLSGERLAEGSEIWNGNDIGMKMAVGYAICLYFLLKGDINKLILLGLIMLFVVTGLLTGSRKVIIMLVVFTALLIIARAKGNKKIIYIAISVLFVFASYAAVMNIPTLYEMVGRRIDLMIAGLTGGDGGFSMTERTLMIGYGFEFFLEKPWFGHGFNAFNLLYGNITGWYVYSHNNFIELLVNTGIIGLVLYYSLTIYILKSLWKPGFRESDTLSQVLFLYTLIAMVLDYAMVSYPSVSTIFRLMYTATYCVIINNKVAQK